MANVKVGWGRCLISGGSTSTAQSTNLDPTVGSNIIPIEGTTQLTTEEGEKLEARYEGGKIAAVKYGADTYVLEFSLWTKDSYKVAADALASANYIYVVPEDAADATDTYALSDIQVVKSTVTGNSSDGYRTNYHIEANTIN
jgi:hypothetical protein